MYFSCDLFLCSVHETSACETEGDEVGRDRRGVVMSNSKQQKAGRSKSSSPNRQVSIHYNHH